MAQADKIDVYDKEPAISLDGTAVAPAVLFSSTDQRDISEFGKAIAVRTPKESSLCACMASIKITLSRSDTKIADITVQEDLRVRLLTWSGDAMPLNKERLLRWFDSRGIEGPRIGIKRLADLEATDRAASDRWLKAMPKGLRSKWPKVLESSSWYLDPSLAPTSAANTLEPSLIREFPDTSIRIRALFAWFGSGAGPWSGYPDYEDVASRLLLKNRPAEVMEALRGGKTLTNAEREGSARFFCVYTYGALFRSPEDHSLIAMMPPELKKSLLDYIIAAGDPEKIREVKSAFGPE